MSIPKVTGYQRLATTSNFGPCDNGSIPLFVALVNTVQTVSKNNLTDLLP